MRRIFALFLLTALAASATAAPQAQLWKRWTAHDAKSTATIDHSAWNSFLQKYVVPGSGKLDLNRVRYGDVSKDDKHKLADYIQGMEQVQVAQYNRDVQRAFWINLYNAETVELILKHYPVDSIRDIGGGLFASGPWDDELLKVDGVKLTLNDIEHRILRPIWHDTLTHYGVNCASVSCPNLLPTAYTGADVNDKLRANARAYVNSPRGLHFKNSKLIVSKIYKWYQSDFGANQTAVVNYLRRFAKPALSAHLDAVGQISGYDYNWALNDAKEGQ